MKTWYRITIFFIIWIIFCAAFYGIVFIIYPNALTKSGAYFDELISNDHLFLIFTQLAMLFGTVGSIMFTSKFIENKKIFLIEENVSVFKFLYGVLLGLFIVSICVFVLSLSDVIRLSFNGVRSETLYYFIVFFIVATSEEMLSRGYILGSLSKEINRNKAIVIASLIFTFLHSLNAAISMIGFLNLFLSGLLFSFLYLKWNGLSGPIGLHFALNWVQGPIFGFSVSGFSTKSVFRIEKLEGDLLTGGNFGLEGSIVLTLVMLPLILLFYSTLQKNGSINKSSIQPFSTSF